MTEVETSAEEFERKYRQLDPKRQKMIGVYVHLLAHDREFQKMPEKDRRALVEGWFEEPQERIAEVPS